MTVYEKIEAQQKGHENTDVWMVGEQLKDICRREPVCEAILSQDLDTKGMDLTAAAGRIKAYADKHRTGNFACVTPSVAEGILRQFYGLPESGAAIPAPEPTPAPSSPKILNLADFL